VTSEPKKRRPVEAIARRSITSLDCERRVRKALTKLTKAGAPFTVENVCELAGVGKTFVYDKRRPELTRAVLAARDASQRTNIEGVQRSCDHDAGSWRERAINAEALAKFLRTAIKERDERISDLTGQLFDPEGNHLAEHNTELRRLLATMSENLRKAEGENANLRRSLTAARANVTRERERNISVLMERRT
jgi:protein-disulfide isomerase-like protein with CxxC motif